MGRKESNQIKQTYKRRRKTYYVHNSYNAVKQLEKEIKNENKA